MSTPKFKVGDSVKYKKGRQTATVKKVNTNSYEIEYTLQWDDNGKIFKEGESSLVSVNEQFKNISKVKNIIREMVSKKK
jgi:uncharacterized protein YkvS